MQTYILFSDGGARGNPGPAGIGFVIQNEEKEVIYEGSEFLGIKTNNQAEYAALLKGLDYLVQHKIDSVHCYLDSELIVKQLNGEYKVKNSGLKPLYEKIVSLQKKHFKHITFSHIPRNKNKHADALVNKAIDQSM